MATREAEQRNLLNMIVMEKKSELKLQKYELYIARGMFRLAFRLPNNELNSLLSFFAGHRQHRRNFDRPNVGGQPRHPRSGHPHSHRPLQLQPRFSSLAVEADWNLRLADHLNLQLQRLFRSPQKIFQVWTKIWTMKKNETPSSDCCFIRKRVKLILLLFDWFCPK